ncbi:MAG: aminomethyl-transferring glycine dehydrogenase subunit GcvPA [Muribaculaceae bacterium]|nr:aminomethyl-transferring glycine dehydrogenase subunit GcvPA [Muribaculaceae bacterium]
MNPYLPHTPEDIASMLGRCGAASLDELFSDVPAQLRLGKGGYALGAPMAEAEVNRYFRSLGKKNLETACFAGAGFYSHYCPAAVEAITSRSEFYTAYTPYQPEISQGTLQYIFEYQSMIASLTGMDVANASMYDGATATAEAMMMAVAASKKRRRVLVSATLLPAVSQVLATYAEGQDIILETVSDHNGATDRKALSEQLGAGDVAAVIVATPNRFGILEDFEGLAEEVHAAKALLIINTHASTLGVLRSQGEWGADIACGEAQSLGIPLNYGGPGLGYLACRQSLMRKMPGRIVGATTDDDGQRVFVLTLQAREQHIRRHKATSNICSNQGLMTLHAAVYLSLLGPEGLREVNETSASIAHDLVARLTAGGKLREKFAGREWLNECVLEIVDEGLTPRRILDACLERGILAGKIIGEKEIMVCATETCTPEDVKQYVEAVEAL